MTKSVLTGWAAVIAVSLAGSTVAQAQRSLFEQPVQNAPDTSPTPAPAPTPAPTAAPSAPARSTTAQAAPSEPSSTAEPAGEPKAKPKKKAKPRGPVPARSLAITNGSPNVLQALEVSQDGKSASLKKPLAAGKKTTLKLPAFKTCEVTVAATFDGGGQPEASTVDICKEKTLNFKD